MDFYLQPTLQDDLVVLRPLSPDDFEALYAVASDPLIWEQHPEHNRWQRPVFETFFQGGMESGGAFLVLDKATGAVAGCTRYAGFDPVARQIEIGWTFLGRQFWGGNHNQAMKKLLLDHAFLFVETVVFYVHKNNFRSQRAVEKLGAVRVPMPEELLAEKRFVESVRFEMRR
ncbi:MAG: GNAT family N-acetyltransferase [Saprospiraceae bacterium]